ncbi:MAG: twin-arginine translocase TatA/TatE family subunit [Muribaculaceae bacterium]|nr:twin-arginine translocase TatA/TatE family subunit [Muribaculaceae bacterium]MDE6574732.1 twin-arginine translocase TatA/TatE family subunit [Muribaculaceae bacterium]
MNLYCITPLFLGNFRGSEILIIGAIILLLFGGKKIPELMKGLGKGVHSFKQGIQEAKEEMNKPVDLESSDNTPADNKKS